MFALIPALFLTLMDPLTLGNSFGLPGLQTPSSVYASSAHLHMVVLVGTAGPQISLAQSSLHSHQPASHLLLGAMSFLFCAYIRGVQGLLEQAQPWGLPPEHFSRSGESVQVYREQSSQFGRSKTQGTLWHSVPILPSQVLAPRR